MQKLTKISSIAAAVSLALALSGPLTAVAAGPAPINLASAGIFTILAKTGISTTGSTMVTGNIGVSPTPASYLTGFALSLPAAGSYSTSAEVSGQVYAADYAPPTPATMTAAILDMQNAYSDGMSRAPDATELGAGTIGGLTLAPGTYKWSSNVTIPSNLTISGGANDVWIFQIAQNLTVSSGVNIVLTGGAQASNVFWVVAGQTTVGTTAVFNGTILDQTSIILNTGAQLNGRAFAQSAVTLQSNAVAAPAAVNTPTPTPAAPVPVVVPSVTPAPSTSSNPVFVQTQTQTPTSLTSQQAQEYNQFIAAGASQSVALNAVQQIQPNQTSTASVSVSPVDAVAVDLQKNARGANVTVLQQFLIAQNSGSAARALSAAGATGYFGALTQTALAEFQAQVGISPAQGYFGPITRSYLSAHY